MAKSKNTGWLKKLGPAQIPSSKELVKRIDKEEGVAIRARGRAIFRRHESIRVIIEALKIRRLEKGLSLADVAERTGIAKPNLSRLENNQRVSPTFETLQRYAQALGMSMQIELVGKN